MGGEAEEDETDIVVKWRRKASGANGKALFVKCTVAVAVDRRL